MIHAHLCDLYLNASTMIISTTTFFVLMVEPAHASRVQGLFSVDTPSQSWPPYCGTGLEQSRERDSTPELQVAEHSPHVLHSVY